MKIKNFVMLKKQLEKIVSKTELVLINHGVGEKEGFKNRYRGL